MKYPPGKMDTVTSLMSNRDYTVLDITGERILAVSDEGLMKWLWLDDILPNVNDFGDEVPFENTPTVKFIETLLRESAFPDDDGNYGIDDWSGTKLYFWTDGVVTWKDER